MANAPGNAARYRKPASSVLAGLVVVGITLAVGLSARSTLDPGPSETAAVRTNTAATPADTAGSFLAALEDMDVPGAGALFSERARVFESGVDQGDWAHYSGGHLMKEFGDMKALAIRRGPHEEIRRGDDSLVVVIWQMEVDATWRDGRITRSGATATFVLREQGAGYLIEHLHWSSRPIGADRH